MAALSCGRWRNRGAAAGKNSHFLDPALLIKKKKPTQDPKAGADEIYAAEEAKMEAEGGKESTSASASASSAAAVTTAAAASPSIPAAKDLKGDGDPLDAVELSETAFTTGTVLPVRILGAFALIDEVMICFFRCFHF